jgi:hypothetical protein
MFPSTLQDTFESDFCRFDVDFPHLFHHALVSSTAFVIRAIFSRHTILLLQRKSVLSVEFNRDLLEDEETLE